MQVSRTVWLQLPHSSVQHRSLLVVSFLQKTLQKFGSHNDILLQRFKEWLKASAEEDESHAYHQQLFTLFGPLLALFITAG
jgi:hypothetical protein